MDADREVYTWLSRWSATVGEELQCAKKLGNVKDRYVTIIITCFMGTNQGQLLLKKQAFKYVDSHTKLW